MTTTDLSFDAFWAEAYARDLPLIKQAARIAHLGRDIVETYALAARLLESATQFESALKPRRDAILRARIAALTHELSAHRDQHHGKEAS